MAKTEKIFGPFESGAGPRYADPWVVERLLFENLEGQLSEIIQAYNSSTRPEATLADRAAAHAAGSKLADAARKTFGLVPFDETTGKGLLEEQCIEVLSTWLTWREKKNPSPSSSPTSAPVMVPAV